MGSNLIACVALANFCSSDRWASILSPGSHWANLTGGLRFYRLHRTDNFRPQSLEMIETRVPTLKVAMVNPRLHPRGGREQGCLKKILRILLLLHQMEGKKTKLINFLCPECYLWLFIFEIVHFRKSSLIYINYQYPPFISEVSVPL